MASIDVVVPCYNYAKYLPGCIASILSQEGVDVRALIIDDASTDDTPAVGTELARNDSRIEYRRHAQNMRHIATYNEGLIGWATADYSLLLSADDLLAPGSLQRATAVMEQRADVHMTYGMALLFFKDEDVEDSPVNAQIPETSIPAFRTVAGPAFIRRSIEGNPVPTPAAIVRSGRCNMGAPPTNRLVARTRSPRGSLAAGGAQRRSSQHTEYSCHRFRALWLSRAQPDSRAQLTVTWVTDSL